MQNAFYYLFTTKEKKKMKNILKISSIAVALALLSGCSGSVYNKEKTANMIICCILQSLFRKSSVDAAPPVNPVNMQCDCNSKQQNI